MMGGSQETRRGLPLLWKELSVSSGCRANCITSLDRNGQVHITINISHILIRFLSTNTEKFRFRNLKETNQTCGSLVKLQQESPNKNPLLVNHPESHVK